MRDFRSRFVLGFLGALLLEQAIVASSTIWIARMTEAATTSRQVVTWLVWFLLSLTLVYIPTSAKNYCLHASKLAAHRSCVARFAAAFHGRAGMARSEKLRNERHAYVTSEAWLVIDEFFEFFASSTGLATNVVLGVAALGLAVTPFVVLAYAASLPLLGVSLRLSSPRLARHSSAAQESRAALTQALAGAWDAILIGNKLNFGLWEEDFHARHTAYRRESLRSVLAVEAAAGLSMVVSLLPLFAILAWIFLRQGGSIPILAVTIATLPRQVQTIQNLGDSIVAVMRWPGVRTKVQGLLRALRPPVDPTVYCGVIHSGQVLVGTPSGESIPLAVCQARLVRDGPLGPGPGRWTIRGPNGSGKSAFLSMMKTTFGERALLLPATTDMPFRSTARRSLSTGEKVKAILTEVALQDDVHVLLLDEWDANLDAPTLSAISGILDQLAETRCLIEVRHRAKEDASPRSSTGCQETSPSR